MTTNNSPDPSDLITRVVDAFERMRVPPGPSALETIELLERGGGRRVQPLSAWHRLALRCKRMTVLQRITVGGIGLSTVVAVALGLLALTSTGRLSAMERMARELREVKSYTYKTSSKSTFVEEGKNQPTVVIEDGHTFWMAPDAFRSEVKILWIDAANPAGKQTERVMEHFDEIFSSGKLGMFIDHRMKTFRRLPYEPIGSTTYPLDLLRMVRENSGEITRDLGTKEIQGKQARGYVIVLQGAHDKRARDQMRDPVEVWVDPATDLPLEFGYEGENETTGTLWITDFRWNVTLDPKLFEPAPPASYVDITPPDGQQELAQIAEALKLYAELSGGHYPRTKAFDAAAVREEMLRLAGFAGPPKPEWTQDKKFLQIQQAARGLDWIALILRNRYHASYDGLTVGPRDKDKLLLWWRVWGPLRYRVFYSDLRTGLLSEAEGAKLGLAEAWPNPPEDEHRPNEKD